MHHTKDKGDLGVLKAQVSLYEKGYKIYVPLSEHSPFDLVAYKDGVFKRIQVKYREFENNVCSIKNSTSWADKNGSHKREYNLSDIDVFCVYVKKLDLCFYFSSSIFDNNLKHVSFRSDTPKNNQKNYRNLYEYLEVP